MTHVLVGSYILVLCLCALAWFFGGNDLYDRNTIGGRLLILLTSAWVTIWLIVFAFHFAIKYW